MLSDRLQEATKDDPTVAYLRGRAEDADRTSKEYDAIAKRSKGTERESAIRTAAEAKGEANAYRDAVRAILKGP